MTERPKGAQSTAGVTWLAAVDDNVPSLWEFPAGAAPTTPRVGLGQQALAALTDARLCAERALPYRFGDTILPQWAVPTAGMIRWIPPANVICPHPVSVDGRSFGLAFGLGCVSHLLDIPLPRGLVASARMSTDGHVSPVHDLRRKADVVAAQAAAEGWGATDLLIADDLGDTPGQTQEDIKHARSVGLTVHRVATIGDAIRLAFPGLEHRLRSSEMASPTRVEACLALALDPRADVSEWAPVARAAQLMVEHWGLTGLLLEKAELARGIASRHAWNRGSVPFPPSSAFSDYLASAHRRITYLSHVVQQANDTGDPPEARVSPEVRRSLPPVADRHPAHWRLAGAWARLLGTSGFEVEALDGALATAASWLASDSSSLDEASRPLSEALRLAGALTHEEAYGRAETLLARWLASSHERSPRSVTFVRWSQCRALAFLGRHEEARSLIATARLAEAEVDDHVRASACRFAIAVAESLGEDAAEWEATLASVPSPEDVELQLALVRLDRQVRIGDPLAALSAARAVAAVTGRAGSAPTLEARLLDVARTKSPEPLGQARWLARFYVY